MATCQSVRDESFHELFDGDGHSKVVNYSYVLALRVSEWWSRSVFWQCYEQELLSKYFEVFVIFIT